MPANRGEDQLCDELESFGRLARGLTANRLQSFPGVLVALFGEEACTDPARRHVLAKKTETVLIDIIAGMRNPTDRQIAEIIFAARPEFHDEYITDRLRYVEVEGGSSIRALHQTKRRRIITEVAASLRATQLPEEQSAALAVAAEEAAPSLSPQARRAARQLYRYAQHALIVVDAFDLCGRFADTLNRSIDRAKDNQKKPSYPHHEWLWEFNGQGTGRTLRFADAPTGRPSIFGLWALAYYHRYLRAVLNDPTGRDLIRVNLPDNDWRWLQAQLFDLNFPFHQDDIDKMLAVLDDITLDYDSLFVYVLRKDEPRGRLIHDKWMSLLLATKTGTWSTSSERATWLPGLEERRNLIDHLAKLCGLLSRVFPDETRSLLYEEFEQFVSELSFWGLHETMGADSPSSYDDARLTSLIQHILRYRPLRYDVEHGDSAWTTQERDPDPWLEFACLDEPRGGSNESES